MPIDVGNRKNRVTVWFNAWKYESTNQIWAGLADAIVKQVTDRLRPMERELFFFKLNLRRLDVAKIRAKITYGFLTSFLASLTRTAWLYLIVPAVSGVALYLYQRLLGEAHQWELLKHWGFLGGALDLVLLAVHYLVIRFRFDKSPAELTFGDLVTAPDYDANLGFVHRVTEDLNTTLKLIAPESRPLVIFIDDLDRCSPNKVSDVVEAINLLLAGEFEHCMFVLGIDDEIVAAALSKSHSEVFAQMPSYSKSTSIGWRFMDKFVQLPFIMPPPGFAEMDMYANSLLLTETRSGKLSFAARQKVADSVEEDHSGVSVDQIVDEVKKELRLDSAQHDELRKEAETIAKMDLNIKAFSDEGTGIAQTIRAGIRNFSRNPRDVKRYVNSFRFYYFLRSARMARQEEAPSIGQLSRWILLSLRWPGIIRWLRSTESISNDGATTGLGLLAEAAVGSADVANWAKSAALIMGLNEKEGTWLADQDLFAFFSGESSLPDAEKLSSSAGKGLW